MKKTLKNFFKKIIKNIVIANGYQIVSSSSLKSDPVLQDEYGDIQNKIESHFSMRKNTFDYPSLYSVFNMIRYVSKKKRLREILLSLVYFKEPKLE